MIITAHHSERYFDSLALLIPAALIALAVWVTFAAATKISNHLGKTGMNVITRIMGLIIAAIGVEYIYRGLIELFPKLV
jgi:multiple antibiotic resistance protein